MQKKSFRLLVPIIILTFITGCSGGQDAAALTTPEVGAVPAQDSEITGIPETTPTTDIESVPCSLPLPGAADWEVVVCETFDDAQSTWNVESQDNPYAKYTSAIKDGKFVVDYTAKGFAGYQRTVLTWFPIGDEKNFALAVTGLMTNTYKDAGWGVAFRGNEDSFFLFSISNDGTYKFEIYENDGWIPLISPKIYNGIQLGEANTLRIEASGQNFFFSINGDLVNQFKGGVLKGTEILLVVSAKEGVSTPFTFDDIVLQR